MIKDYVVVGAAVGIGADLVKLSANYIMHLLGFTPVVFWQLVATRFLDRKELFSPIAYLVGGIADLTVTALMGVIFVYFIYFFGSRFLWIKGIGFGLAVWVAVFGTLVGQSVQAKLPQQPSGIVVTIVAHFLFGLTLALFTGLLHHEKAHTAERRSKVFHLIPEPARKAARVKQLLRKNKGIKEK